VYDPAVGTQWSPIFLGMFVSRLLLLVTLVLAAPATFAKKEPTPAELARTHGLVTVRIHKSGLPPGLVSPQSFGVEPAMVISPVGEKDGRESLWLPSRDPDDEVPGIWVKAGTYQLSAWRGPWPGGPELEVVAGRVLDLGDLLEVSLGGVEVVLSPFTHPELEGELERRLQPLLGVLADPEPLRWRSPRVLPPSQLSLGGNMGLIADGMMQGIRKKLVTAPRERLRAITDPAVLQREVLDALPPLRDVSVVDAQGRQYFGAAFGRIRVRDPDGRWSTIDTGALGDVMTLHLEGDRLLAGIGSGTGRILQRIGDGEWTVLKRFALGVSVEDIDRVDGRWFVVVTKGGWPDNFLTADSASVLAGEADDYSDLAEIRSIEHKRFPRFNWDPQGHVQGGFYYVNGRDELWRLELANGQWTRLAAKAPLRMSVSPRTGTIATAGGTNVFAAMATPGGLPATKFEKLKWGGGLPLEAWVDDRQTGWAVGTAKMAMLNDAAPMAIARLGAAQRWEPVAETPKGCSLVLRDTDGVPRYCATALGTIMRRDDAEWTTEFALD
jgi:hypothetical protein